MKTQDINGDVGENDLLGITMRATLWGHRFRQTR
jgi:hypothetical protein